MVLHLIHPLPLTCTEKVVTQIKLHGPGSQALAIEAGEAFNVVPTPKQVIQEIGGFIRSKLKKLHLDMNGSGGTSPLSLVFLKHSKMQLRE